jgi:hypothetical protein
MYLLKKYVVATSLLITTGLLLLYCTAAKGQPRLLLLCNHYNDGIVSTEDLSVATMGYDPLVQMCIVVV